MAVFLKTDMVPDVALLTIMSYLPSPSISPIETPFAPVPAAISTFVANEAVVIEPVELVFR